jgi:hypothetical protein
MYERQVFNWVFTHLYMIVSTRKSRELWAKKKAKELGNIDSIHFGETHASFIKKGKSENFSATQIRYPDSMLGFTGKLLIRGTIMLFGALFGAGVGIMLGSFLSNNIWMWILGTAGFIIGGICGFKDWTIF